MIKSDESNEKRFSHSVHNDLSNQRFTSSLVHVRRSKDVAYGFAFETIDRLFGSHARFVYRSVCFFNTTRSTAVPASKVLSPYGIPIDFIVVNFKALGEMSDAVSLAILKCEVSEQIESILVDDKMQ